MRLTTEMRTPGAKVAATAAAGVIKMAEKRALIVKLAL
jgi:hypothetical protein